MELLDQELQLQPAEADVTRGLIALNRAQDLIETLMALRPNIKVSAIGTVTTAASTEATAVPAGLLRIDAMFYIDPTTSLPQWKLDRIDSVGGHSIDQGWPHNIYGITSGAGKPNAYWENGTNIYWSPLPDGTHTVRYHGFAAASDISAAGTFAYPDIMILPVASIAVKLMQTGVGDGTGELTQFATSIIGPVLATLERHNRDGGQKLRYTRHHST